MSKVAGGEGKTTELSASDLVLPPDAVRRLQDSEGSGDGPGIFTSDLSVSEFLLIRRAGFRPRGLVMGSSIFHIGLQGRSWTKNEELKNLSSAMYSARERAMERMEVEAGMLGADGVVAVRLTVNFYDWGRHSAEFIAIGTAVSAEKDPGSWRLFDDRPFTSDLSGLDFWTLIQAGYAPLGLVMGTCVYHVAHRNLAKVVASVTQNVELDQFSQALYEARELAMERMQAEGLGLGAEGIVGVQLEQKSHFWGSHVIEFFAVGTAVRPLEGGPYPVDPQFFVPLDG